PEPDGTSAKVFISETLQPDPAVGVQLVAGAKLNLRSASGKETLLNLVKTGDAYVVEVEGQGLRLGHGDADLGLSPDGSTKPYLVLYHPKTILGDAFDSKTVVGESAPVEIVPAGKSGNLTLRLLAHGNPLPNAEITAILPDGSQKKLKTDASSQTEVLSQFG